MSFTLSFDASQKIKAADAKGISNHIFRDALDVDLEHSNQAIDPSLTQYNESFYYDQKANGFKKCTSVSQVQESLQDRLSEVKKPLRKDAVVARGLILQLDPEYFQEGMSKTKVLDAHTAMLKWAMDTFKAKNLIGLSVHLDESNPHMHILFTPVTDDGRLSQKDWFPDPVSLRKMHEDLRQYMEQEGYDINHDRQPKRKHMSVTEYKAFREAKDKAQELQDWELDLKQRTTRINDKEASLEAREGAFEASKEEFRSEVESALQLLEQETERALQASKETQYPYLSEFFGAFPPAKQYYEQFKAQKEQEIQQIKDTHITGYAAKVLAKYEREKQQQLNESLLPRQQRSQGYDFGR